MTAVLALIGVLLGSAVAPASIAAITTLQWVELGLAVAKGAPPIIQADARLLAVLNSPQFRELVAENARRNGDLVIRMYPGNNNF